MSNTLASCEVVTTEGGSSEVGKFDTKENGSLHMDTNGTLIEVHMTQEHQSEADESREDDGEASDEGSSRRESTSSRDGNEDVGMQTNNTNNEDQDKTDNNKQPHELETNTPRKKKKKRRSRRKHSVSRYASSPDFTTPMGSTQPAILSKSTSEPLPISDTTDDTEDSKDTREKEATYTTTTTTTSTYSPHVFPRHLEDDLSHIPPHLLELTPPPTRGRSNAFYGAKPLPPLIHSHSDGAAIVAAQSQNAANAAASAASISPRRNTSLGLSVTPSIPEPSHSGISKPKMFNYWRSFAGSGYEKSVLSHSKRFLVGFAETIGRRPSMEDCMVVHGAFRGRGHEDYFALFDGHGGRDAAAFAAANLHIILAEKLKTNNAVKSLKEAFADTHRMIAEQKIIGGTTAVVALFIGKKGFIANVGDTRAVLCRDGVPLRVSLDHKPELPAEMLRIRNLGGTVTTTYNSAGQATSRVNGMLAVSRALGDTVLHPYVSSDPEIHGPLNLDTELSNQFVVLACDGVWDVLSDEEATSIVAPIANPEIASRRLRDEAYARGSTDNISVMVIRCPPFMPCD